MGTTLRVVKVAHCTWLQFRVLPASQAPSSMLISVDEFN